MANEAIVNSLDDGTTAQDLMRRYYPLIFESAFGDASLAGVPVAFDLESEHIQELLDDLAGEIKNIAETTRDDIRRLIGKQSEEGWSNEELGRRIREMGEINSRSRAVMIARTETGNAYNRSAILAYREGGVTHVDVLDGDDDEPCASANGSRWTLDEAEANPLGHPNCTRAFSPVVE